MSFQTKDKKKKKDKKQLQLEEEDPVDQLQVTSQSKDKKEKKSSKKKSPRDIGSDGGFGEKKSKKKGLKKGASQSALMIEVEEETDESMSFWESEIKSIKDQIGSISNSNIIDRIDMLQERISSNQDVYNLPSFVISHRCQVCQLYKNVLNGAVSYSPRNGSPRNRMEQMEISNEEDVNKITREEKDQILQEQDKQLNEIFDGVVGLEKTAKDIGEEATKQNQIIIDLEGNIERGTDALLGANQKTEALAADSNNCSLYLTIGGLLILLILVFFMGFGSGI